MTFSELKNFIKMERFIETFCPSIKNVKHKLRGLDGNNNSIDFSESDKQLIADAMRKFSKEMLKVFMAIVLLFIF